MTRDLFIFGVGRIPQLPAILKIRQGPNVWGGAHIK